MSTDRQPNFCCSEGADCVSFESERLWRRASGVDLADLRHKAFTRDPVARFSGPTAKEEVVHGFAGVTDMDWREGRAFKQVSSFGLEDQGGSIRPVYLQTSQTRGQDPDGSGQRLAAISAIEMDHGGEGGRFNVFPVITAKRRHIGNPACMILLVRIDRANCWKSRAIGSGLLCILQIRCQQPGDAIAQPRGQGPGIHLLKGHSAAGCSLGFD